MISNDDIKLGCNATVYYLKHDEFIIYEKDYFDYKKEQVELVELTGKIVGFRSSNGKNSKGEPLLIEKVFVLFDNPNPFSFRFDQDYIDDYNERLSAYCSTMGWLGSVEDCIDKYGCWLLVSKICAIQSSKVDPKSDGCSCKTCRTFIQYAAPNQPDGTLLCFSCRGNPVRAYY